MFPRMSGSPVKITPRSYVLALLFADPDTAGAPNATFAHTAGTGLANLLVFLFLNHHPATRRPSLYNSPLNSWAILIDTNTARADLHTHLGLGRCT
jgi:hypothetical protein